jgi:hypothetical protein
MQLAYIRRSGPFKAGPEGHPAFAAARHRGAPMVERLGIAFYGKKKRGEPACDRSSVV